MNWILALSLFSSPDGYYVKVYPSEQACVKEMKTLISKMEKGLTKDVKNLSCIPESMALND